jgi:hypothetical protein
LPVAAVGCEDDDDDWVEVDDGVAAGWLWVAELLS